MNKEQLVEKFWDNCLKFAQKHGPLFLSDRPFEEKLAAYAYDAAYAFSVISDHLNDSSLDRYQIAAEDVYKEYLRRSEYLIPPHWLFTDTPRSYNGDEDGSYLTNLCSKALYARDTTNLDDCEDPSNGMARAVAFVLYAYYQHDQASDIKGVSCTPRTLRASYEELIFKHWDDWFRQKKVSPVVPFMVGLSARTLAEMVAMCPTLTDKVLDVLEFGLSDMWDLLWVPGANAFRYQSVEDANGDTLPAPNLNMLIAPAYAFVYYLTGDEEWADRAWEIFEGGLTRFDEWGNHAGGAYLWSPKVFNQQLFWADRFFKWMELEKKEEPEQKWQVAKVILTVEDRLSDIESRLERLERGEDDRS